MRRLVRRPSGMLRFAARPILAIAFLLPSFGAAAASLWPDPPTEAHQVTVIADGETREVPTQAATVDDLLSELEISLDPLDRSDPDPEAPIEDGMSVRITRVSRHSVTEHLALPADTIVLADPDRPFGSASILARGSDGLLRRVWRTWRKDGEITTRTVISEQLLSEPQDKVVLRGSRGMPRRAGYWRRWRAPMVMEATAYEPGPRSCGKWATGYTATGVKAEKGVVAVDERVIPLGTRLYIPGYGFAVAADRGSAIKGMRIDLCFPTYAEAIQFGRRRTKVYRLD